MRLEKMGLLALAVAMLPGCAVVSVATTAVSATAAVAGLAVDTVEVAGKGVVKAGEVVVDAVKPAPKPTPDDAAKQ